MNPLKVAIHGAAGRMGQRLVALGSADKTLRIVAAVDRAGHPQAGTDAGTLAGAGPIGVALGDKLPEGVDVVIDFSVPAAVPGIVDQCLARKVALVVATTGLEPE